MEEGGIKMLAAAAATSLYLLTRFFLKNAR